MHGREARALTGVVLAGGQSRRMGQDKALLAVDGEPLVARVARRLQAVCERVLIASGDRRLGIGYEEVADARPGRGPLAGIVAGLEASRTPLVAVVAVDMPFADPAVLSYLADAWDREVAVVPAVRGRVHPLHGVYATQGAADLRRCLAHGERQVTAALTKLGARVIGEDGWGRVAADNGRFATNINRPEDVE